jgi:hypothetical protein
MLPTTTNLHDLPLQKVLDQPGQQSVARTALDFVGSAQLALLAAAHQVQLALLVCETHVPATAVHVQYLRRNKRGEILMGI